MSIHFNLLKLLALFSAVGCGLLSGSGSSAINDATPDGTITHSGSFGTNSNSISGTVFVYVSGGSTTVRLESFSASTMSGILVQGDTSDGNTPLNTGLKGTSGNQNYSVGSVAATWVSVKIIDSTQASPNDIQATAILEAVND